MCSSAAHARIRRTVKHYRVVPLGTRLTREIFDMGSSGGDRTCRSATTEMFGALRERDLAAQLDLLDLAHCVAGKFVDRAKRLRVLEARQRR